MNDKGKQFYDYLVSKEIKVPSTYEEFQSSMQDSNTAEQFHSFVKSKGIAVPESVDEFSSVFAIDSDVKKKEVSTSKSPTQDGVSVSTEPEIGLDELGQEVSLAPSEQTPEFLQATSYQTYKEQAAREEKVSLVQSYEENQKTLSNLDKAISAGEMTDMSAKDRMLLGVSQGRIDQRVDELKTQREAVAKTSDQLVEETQKDVTNIVNEGIGDNWEDFVGDDGVVDVSKVGDFARTSAREYGVPEDGYFFQRVKDAAQAKIELEQIRPTTESILLGEPLMAPKGVNIDGETISIVRKRSVKLDEESDDPSTVLMASHGNYSPPDAEGKFVAFPTIFPKDPKKQTGRVEDWIVAENEDQAYEIAKERGEVLYYDTPEEANAVAEGSWKEEKTKGLYEEMYGVKPEDDAEKMLSREDVQKNLGIAQLNADFSMQMEQLRKNIEKSSGEEIDRINQERYGMSVDDYASSIANDYKQTQESLSRQYKALEDRYAPFINEKNEFTGSPEMYQEYNAALEQLNNANAASNELYKTQFESLVSQNTKDVASINNKYNRRFNRQQQEIFNAYKSEYAEKAEGISPMLQERYQKAYGRALEKAMKEDQRFKDTKARMGAEFWFGPNAGELISSGYVNTSSYISGLANNLKSLSRAMGSDGEFWEQVAKDTDAGDVELNGFKDWINPAKLTKSISYTLGGMTPGLLASFGTGGVGAYAGAGTLATTLAAGTAGWGVESATIVQDAYDQKFKETGSATKAEDAASKSLKGQVMLMPMYALEMVPFFGDLATKLGKIGLDNMAARFAVGGATETVAEMGQEYPQQLFEQAIADDKDLSDAFDYASVKGFKDTFVNVAPTTLLLGGVGAALDIKTSKEDMARSLAMKVKMGNLTDAALEQNMLKMTVNEGQKFAKAFIDTQLRNGAITEEQATKATLAIESSVATIEKGKEYNLDNKNNYILATLDLKLKAAKEKAEAETDPMMKGIAEKKVKKIESQAEQLLETGNADVAVVTYPDNSFDILTHDEARLAMSRDEFLQNFANGDLKVEAMGNGQAKLMSELQEKSKPFAPEEKTTTEEDKFEASIREEKEKDKKKGILRTIGDKISKASAKRYNKKYYASLDEIYQEALGYYEQRLEDAREREDDLDIDYYEKTIKEIKSSSPEQVAQDELDYQKQRLEEDFVSDAEINRSLQIDRVAGIERLEELLGQTPTQEEVARREFIIDNVKDDTQVTEQERLDTEEQGRQEDTGEVQEPEVSEEEGDAGPVLQEQEETVSTSEDKLREMEANARKKHRLNPVKRNRKLAAIRAVRSAMQSLSGIAPDVKIVVHDTAESYAKAADEIERSKQDLSKGAWDPDTNTIHINLDKAGSRTVAHETFHALLFNRFKDEGKIQAASEKLISELRSALRGDAKLTAYLDEFATRYSDQDVISEEQLAELIGIIVENYNSFNARAKRAVENFINTVISALGMDKIEGLFPKKISGNEAADMMTAIGERIAKGEVITEEDVSFIEAPEVEIDEKVAPKIKKRVSDIKKKNVAGKKVGKGLSVKQVKGEKVKEGIDNISVKKVREVNPKLYIKNANAIKTMM